MLLLPLVVAAAADVGVAVAVPVVHGHGKFMHNFSRFQKIFASLIVAKSSAWRHRIVAAPSHHSTPIRSWVPRFRSVSFLLFSLRRCLRLKLANINGNSNIHINIKLHRHAGRRYNVVEMFCQVLAAQQQCGICPLWAVELQGEKQLQKEKRNKY